MNPKHQKQPPEMFYKKGVPKKFTESIGKHLCQSLFLNKVAGLQRCHHIETSQLIFRANSGDLEKFVNEGNKFLMKNGNIWF